MLSKSGLSSEMVILFPVFSLTYMWCMFMSNLGLNLEGLMILNDWWGLDWLGVTISLLSVIVGIMSLTSETESFVVEKNAVLLGLCVVSAVVVCLCCFCTTHLFLFFFFFESSSLPMMLFLLMYGSYPERIQATMHMVLYLFCSSLPMLLCIIDSCDFLCSDSLLIIKTISPGYSEKSCLFWVFLLGAMVVKSPMYLVHGWLTKAHVEASTGGSVLLAGMLLKLSLVGFVRLVAAFGLMPVVLAEVLVVIYVWGAVICSLLCFSCPDLKTVIAYSSIVHMGLGMAALLSGIFNGWSGSISLSLGHGICSSCMFMMAGIIISKVGSRIIMLCKGMYVGTPFMTLLWFLFCCINNSVPPCFSFFAECMIYMSVLSYLGSMFCLVIVGMYMLGGSYGIILFSHAGHGVESSLIKTNSKSFTLREVMSLIFSLPFLILGSLEMDFMIG